ncbi:condensation domain-containing protein [Saccharothrix algeriensis]|uniref:Condensation domain-containing protein n=2 Tax=Saccharothrix algeriensis TaxID=173560 RepID=A0ABS2SEX5_9PSEU|nr:condensation domain-containing protein [Saccharothrix algeriensis]MBM7814470.1 hypothetical protein [Saccharothrix algeriensis]
MSVWRAIGTNPLVDGVRSQLTSVRPVPAGATEQRVRAVVDALWRRHESLRTTFDQVDGQARQVVHQRPRDVFEVRSLDAVEDLAPCAAELFAGRLALSGGFAWRVRLMLVADGTAAVAVAVHHILADGWALRLLLAELDLGLTDPAAARAVLGSPAPAPAALARRQWSAAWAARRSAARAHWTRVTEEFGPPAPAAGPPGERICASLDLGAAGGAVAELVDRHRVTAQTIVLALYALGVRATTGRQRLVVHLMAANRLRPEWHDLVTSMNQLVPAGIVVDDEGGVADLLRHAQTAGLAAMRNGCHDEDEVAAITGQPPGSPVDHVLNYMPRSWPRPAPPARGPRPPVRVGPSTRPAIAGVYGLVTGGESPALELHADSGSWPEARLRRFLGGTEKALRRLATRQDARVADLVALY